MTKNPQGVMALWIFFGLVVWLITFRGFLNSSFDLESDAFSYYDHTKFLVENLSHGVFPLWDPFWCNGAPNDFFLRRIGALNPLYTMMSILNLLGLSFRMVYLYGLAFYYWGGMIAFYLLANRIYQDRLLAYAGYLILLFSALGTRIFDSYMMLITVPLLWLFYFLVSFTQKPTKIAFLGLVLSLMVLMSTYIPFYFVMIMLFFGIFFCLFYIEQVPKIFSNFLGFFKANKWLVFFGIGVIALACIPLLSFFKESLQGHLVMPARHGDIGNKNVLTVPQHAIDWGAVEDLFYSGYFSNLRMFKFAVVYVPFFSVILIVLGLITRISRRAAFLFILGVGLFCCIVPHGLPFYDFLYKHFFVFKLFRNLHFFIWFFLIPLFVFWSLENWHLFKQLIDTSNQKFAIWLYLALAHLGVGLFVFLRHDAILSTYITIFLSLVFWSALLFKNSFNHQWILALLTLTILIQPLEAYHYFNLKGVPFKNTNYLYDFSFFKTYLKNPVITDDVSSKSSLYYATEGYNFIYNNLSSMALMNYLKYKFILVDHLEVIHRENLDIQALENHFLNYDNTAVIFTNNSGPAVTESDDPQPSKFFEPIQQESQQFKILSMGANHLTILTNFPYSKFLIYNDSYTPDWHVKINDQTQELYEANAAFKGVWVPAGRNIVEFRYGNFSQYLLNISLSLIAFAILMVIIWYAYRP